MYYFFIGAVFVGKFFFFLSGPIVDIKSARFETISHAALTALHTIEVFKESLCTCSYVQTLNVFAC